MSKKISAGLKIVVTRIGEPTPEEYAIRKSRIDSPMAVFDFWKTIISQRPDFESEKENLITILVDIRFRPIAYNLVALGALNECVAHPREILRPAIVASAYGFVLSHNHPSGDPTPSDADRVLTSKVKQGAEFLQIAMLDHVVVGDESGSTANPFFSFKQAGMI